ncbi:MAG: flagellar motor switch protein FliN [Rhizobiaceae bacterium]|nr:flagellar motor switch protein FliN [Rhizobiaceae bacterium]
MAPKKAKLDEQELDTPGNDAELDQAIDDLRGVLKADEQGLPAGGSDFGMDFGTAGDDGAIGDFSAGTDLATGFGDDFGAADHGFGDTGFDGGTALTEHAMAEPGSAMNSNLDLIMDIPIDVQIVLGSSRMQVSGLMDLTEGATIALDRKIGEPVDLIVNGRLIGRGEITVLENDETRFGIKLIEVMPVRKT